jgi:ABC-type phosphate transport system substrate-binding protein
MSYTKVFSLAVLAFSAALTVARGADFKVVANPSVGAASISADELKGVFLMTKTSLKDAGHVEPVLEKGGPVHESFVKEYLGKTDAGLQNYYRSLAFTGKGSIPKEVASDADVVSTVAKTKGAIGYIGAETEAAGVKVLEVK